MPPAPHPPPLPRTSSLQGPPAICAAIKVVKTHGCRFTAGASVANYIVHLVQTKIRQLWDTKAGLEAIGCRGMYLVRSPTAWESISKRVHVQQI